MDRPYSLFKEALGDRTLLLEKFPEEGFLLEDGAYLLRKELPNSGFLYEIRIDEDGDIKERVSDPSFGDSYPLASLKDPRGAFSYGLRSEILEWLSPLVSRVSRETPFLTAKEERVARYFMEKYGERVENPFSDEEGARVIRRPDNSRWYVLFMKVEARKLNMDGNLVNILNIKLPPRKIETLLTQEGYRSCYHMNKKHWITILADVLDIETIIALSEESRSLVGHK